MGAELPVNTLKKRADFVRLTQSGKRFVVPAFVVQMLPTPDEVTLKTGIRVGFTATKTLGGAVIRNRVKRRLRAAAAQILPVHGRAGMDYVFIGRKASFDRPFATLLKDMQFALAELARRS